MDIPDLSNEGVDEAPDDPEHAIECRPDEPHAVADSNTAGQHQAITVGRPSYGAAVTARLIAEGANEEPACALGRLADSAHSLGAWAARYMLVKVCGSPKNTVAAKTRDIAEFATWFVEHRASHAEAAGDISAWTEADTRYFLRHMEAQKKSTATINRTLYTLKHFARYVLEQPGSVFDRHGFPVGSVQALQSDEPECKKLSMEQMQALFAVARAAADKAQKKGRAAATQSRDRPQRDLAILGLFYYTGLRVSEVVELTRAQYDGDALHHVRRKGTGRLQHTLAKHTSSVRAIAVAGDAVITGSADRSAPLIAGTIYKRFTPLNMHLCCWKSSSARACRPKISLRMPRTKGDNP